MVPITFALIAISFAMFNITFIIHRAMHKTTYLTLKSQGKNVTLAEEDSNPFGYLALLFVIAALAALIGMVVT